MLPLARFLNTLATTQWTSRWPSSLRSHRLWTWFLQIHILWFAWSLLPGWLPDPNSIMAGLLLTLRDVRLSQAELFIPRITSHFHTLSKHPCSIASLSTQCEGVLFSLARWILSRDHLLAEERFGKDKKGPRVGILPFTRISFILRMQMTLIKPQRVHPLP